MNCMCSVFVISLLLYTFVYIYFVWGEGRGRGSLVASLWFFFLFFSLFLEIWFLIFEICSLDYVGLFVELSFFNFF